MRNSSVINGGVSRSAFALKNGNFCCTLHCIFDLLFVLYQTVDISCSCSYLMFVLAPVMIRVDDFT